VLDRRPAKVSTALNSSLDRGSLPQEQPSVAARFREALRLDPEHPAGWIKLGIILRRRGEGEEAERAWAHALSCGRAKRLAARVAISEPVACSEGARP